MLLAGGKKCLAKRKKKKPSFLTGTVGSSGEFLRKSWRESQTLENVIGDVMEETLNEREQQPVIITFLSHVIFKA